MLHSHVFSRLLTFLFLVHRHVGCLASDSSPSSITPNPLFVKESSALPAGWSLDTHRPASPKEFIAFHIALAQSDPSGLERTLLRVSDPASPSYGKYLSRNAVLKFLAPTNSTASAVKSWLDSHGIRTSTKDSSEFSVSPTHDCYRVNITVNRADKLMGTTFRAYKNADTGERIVRALSYSLPKSLQHTIDTIQPTTIFRSSFTRRNTARVTFHSMYGGSSPLEPSQFPNCTNSMTSVVPPWCAKKLYDVENYAPLPPTTLKGNMVGMCVHRVASAHDEPR